MLNFSIRTGKFICLFYFIFQIYTGCTPKELRKQTSGKMATWTILKAEPITLKTFIDSKGKVQNLYLNINTPQGIFVAYRLTLYWNDGIRSFRCPCVILPANKIKILVDHFKLVNPRDLKGKTFMDHSDTNGYNAIENFFKEINYSGIPASKKL